MVTPRPQPSVMLVYPPLTISPGVPEPNNTTMATTPFPNRIRISVPMNSAESSAANVGFLSMAGVFTITRRRNVILYRFHVQSPCSSRTFGWVVVDRLGPDTMGRGRAHGSTHRHLSGLRSESVEVVGSDDAARGGCRAGCDGGAILLADA